MTVSFNVNHLQDKIQRLKEDSIEIIIHITYSLAKIQAHDLLLICWYYQETISVKTNLNNMEHKKIVSSVYDVVSSNVDFFRDSLRLSGILYRYPSNNDTSEIDILSCSLTPYVIPEVEFERIKKTQLIYQKLLIKAVSDKEFLNQTFKETAKNDTFV